MNTLSTNKIRAFTANDENIVNCDMVGLPMAASVGHRVTSYLDLLHKVATLQYHNPRFRLLFRGQSGDYKLDRNGEPGIHSSLYPSILRGTPNVQRTDEYLDERFERLAQAENLLKAKLRVRDIHQNHVVRWAILQHYEVCPTPLLDITLSLQTAITFAIGSGDCSGFLYVFAFPQLTGAVSVSVESMTQVIDLCQLCPPEARRPHFQYGMLAGDYPTITNRTETHGQQGMIGNNFACRLLTKFALEPCPEWNIEGYVPVPDGILFPNATDDWFPITQGIKSQLNVI